MMSKRYEYVTLDAGHEYTQPCEVLFENTNNYLIKVKDVHEELLVGKGMSSHFVREVKEKVVLTELIQQVALAADKECDNMPRRFDEDWLEVFMAKLIKAGALKEGMYEI